MGYPKQIISSKTLFIYIFVTFLRIENKIGGGEVNHPPKNKVVTCCKQRAIRTDSKQKCKNCKIRILAKVYASKILRFILIPKFVIFKCKTYIKRYHRIPFLIMLLFYYFNHLTLTA